ncbi:MAG: type II secretion system F family protein [Candidatus Xenobia bacterium]
MPLYEYKAYNTNGRMLKGLIDAPSSASAYERVKQRGLFPASISEDSGRATGARGVAGETMAFTLVQLSTLLRAGVPLPSAMESLSTQVENSTMQRALVRVRVRLSEGTSFAEALSQERIFPPLLIRLVEAGSSVGDMENILERFAEFVERQEELKKKVVGAMVYPIVVLCASMGLILFMLTYVAPTIFKIYADMGKELPWPTIVVMTIGNFLQNWLPIVGVMAVIAIFCWIRFVPRAVKDSWALRVPFFGHLLLVAAAARWARTLAMLHGGGVPLQRALRYAREVMDNAVLQADMIVVEQQVELGTGLAAALRRVWRMPSLLAQMAETGEKSAALENLMQSAAGFYEKEIDRRVGIFFRILEPAMILILGLVVGFVVIAVMLPIINMSNMVQ